MIVVSGVKDTGLCGGYWGNTETLGSRRRSKPVEALQIGKTEKTASRRGSVGSVGSSVDTTPSNKKTPQTKKLVAGTPQTKSNKKQVTKPEKSLEAMESSQSESEADSEQNTSKAGRGRKRKNEDTPVVSQEKKAKTSKKESVKASKEEQDEEDLKASFSDYDSGANETQPLRTTKRPSAKTAPDSPAKEAPLTSKQQTAVSAALAAGWRTPPHRGRWWSSVLLRMMIPDGSILARRGMEWPLMLYSTPGLSGHHTICCHF